MITQGHVLGDERLRDRFLQWFGCDHVAARRQHLAAESGFQALKVGIATEYQAGSAHFAVCGVHRYRGAVVDAKYGALFKDLHPQGLRRSSFALHQIQGM